MMPVATSVGEPPEPSRGLCGCRHSPAPRALSRATRSGASVSPGTRSIALVRSRAAAPRQRNAPVDMPMSNVHSPSTSPVIFSRPAQTICVSQSLAVSEALPRRSAASEPPAPPLWARAITDPPAASESRSHIGRPARAAPLRARPRTPSHFRASSSCGTRASRASATKPWALSSAAFGEVMSLTTPSETEPARFTTPAVPGARGIPDHSSSAGVAPQPPPLACSRSSRGAPPTALGSVGSQRSAVRESRRRSKGPSWSGPSRRSAPRATTSTCGCTETRGWMPSRSSGWRLTGFRLAAETRRHSGCRSSSSSSRGPLPAPAPQHRSVSSPAATASRRRTMALGSLRMMLPSCASPF
mmetsp:Transcript_117541/g.252663  ORF Transcript_117541/g.252663 Transcript_117541/m.252663 type:complete len:357 (+) Transcript_117541:623-1693(+)